MGIFQVIKRLLVTCKKLIFHFNTRISKLTTVQMNPTNSVSVSGLIQNTLNTGSSIEACLAELIDNSLGAGATKIVATLQTDGSRVLTIADNGTKTMNREGLKRAMTLHARSSASDDRPGRFGFGMKQAGISLTRHRAATTVISKSEETGEIHNGLHMIVADWNAAVNDDVYYPVPQEIGIPSLKIWEAFAISPHRKGTVIQNPCDTAVYDELKEKLGSKDVRTDVLYKLGIWYHQYLKEGVTMTVKVGEVSHPVVAIDPLELGSVAPEHKRVIKCVVMKKGDDVRTYFQNKQSWMRYPTSRHKNPLSDSAGYTVVGEFTYTLAYSSTWDEQTHIKQKYFSEETPTAEDMVYLGGLYMKRTKRVIANEEINKQGSGDQSYQKVTILSRGLVEFPTALDDYFSIMVNKSKMEMELVHSSVMTQLRKLHSLFVKELHTKYYPKKKEVCSSSSDEEGAPVVHRPSKQLRPVAAVVQQAQPVNAAAAVSIVDAIRHAAAENVLVPIVTVAQQQQQQQPVVKITQKAPDTSEEVKLQPQPTQIKVRESVRTPPKSEQDVLALHHEITKLFPDEQRRRILESASPVAAEGLANLYNALQQLKELYEKY
jgi:hypothetical protein